MAMKKLLKLFVRVDFIAIFFDVIFLASVLIGIFLQLRGKKR